MINKSNLITYMLDFECGTITKNDFLELFSYIIKTKLYNSLQGLYGRTCDKLIKNNIIDIKGNIL